MAISFGDLVAPVTDLGQGDPLEYWRWLVGPSATPLLLTALGDMFVQQPGGTVQFVDTYDGNLKPAGADRGAWKVALQDEANVDLWFSPGLIEALQQRGLALAEGQTYSPKQPPVLGGSMEPDNFEPVPWRVHFEPMGQIHQQVKNLPPGTRINGIKIDWK